MFRKTLEIREHSGAVYSCDFDGEFIYSGSADKFVTRWDLIEGIQDKFAIRFENPVYSVAVKEKKLYVGLNNGDLHVFDLLERKELKFFKQHTAPIFSISASVDNRIYVGDAEGNLSVWDHKTLEQLIYLPFDCGKLRDIEFNKNADKVVLSCGDGTVRILDTRSFNEILTINAHTDGTTAAVFHPEDQDLIITGGKDAHLRTWNLVSSAKIKEIPAHNYAIYRILSCGNKLLTASRDKSIKVWDLDLSFIQKLDVKAGGHNHSVNDLTLISENSFISCGDDRRIILWELEKN